MRTLVKLVLLVVLVITLAILLQPQPSVCATMWEYGRFCGEVAIPGVGIKPAEIAILLGEPNATGKLTIGIFGILLNDKWRVFNCTASINETTGEIYITTNTVDDYHALLYYDSSSVYLQVPGKGISGVFTECP
jgi:hypothetical protein